jgi:hypothetical protein
VGLIWQTLVDSGMPPGPDLPELQRRLQDAIANHGEGMTLEELEIRLRERRKKTA